MDREAAKEYHRRREARHKQQREAERQKWLARAQAEIADLALRFPEIKQVYLFGSIVQPGRFRPGSDIDVAVESDSVQTESNFWRALERALEHDVDVRPLSGPIARAVELHGIKVYERESPAANQ